MLKSKKQLKQVSNIPDRREKKSSKQSKHLCTLYNQVLEPKTHHFCFVFEILLFGCSLPYLLYSLQYTTQYIIVYLQTSETLLQYVRNHLVYNVIVQYKNNRRT